MDNLKMNNGYLIPQFGIGMFRLTSEEAEKATLIALNNGYRHIDTANFYMNEKAVGRAIKASKLPREEIFLTSKVFPGYYNDIHNVVSDTLKRLDVDYLDLFLLHQPFGNIKKAWLDLEKEVEAGRIRSIGVSNFSVKEVDELLSYAKIKPVVNQIECHPYCDQEKIRIHHSEHGILIEAWYPLASMNKKLMSEPIFDKLSKKYNKSKVQIILRWHIQMGNIVFPGSRKENHIKDNIDIYDFSLTKEEMDEIKLLNKDKKFLRIPKLLGKVLMPLFKMNFNKQK